MEEPEQNDHVAAYRQIHEAASSLDMTQGSPAPNFRQDEFNRFLNTWADDSMHIVLKGHLFIERELYTLLAAHVPNPAYVESAGLRWKQLVGLVRAYANDDPGLTWLWQALTNLNELRNSFAHALAPPDAVAKEQRFVERVRPQIHPWLLEHEDGHPNNALRAALRTVAETVHKLYAPEGRLRIGDLPPDFDKPTAKGGDDEEA